MTQWLNHAAIAADRQGTATHTVSPASGTVVNGTLFSPTNNNLLIAIMYGGVTSTTPSGWTLATGGSAISNGALYLWYKIATGNDTFTTTHNGSNYPIITDFYEFPAGSTFASSVAAGGVSRSGGAGPQLSGLTGTNFIGFVVGQDNASVAAVNTVSWSIGTKLFDTSIVKAATDGYTYSLAYIESSTQTTASSAATISSSSTNVERLVYAINVNGSGTNAAPVVSAGVDQNAIEPWDSVTITGTATDSDGTIATTNWTQTAGPDVTSGWTSNGFSRTFTAPAVLSGTTLSFRFSATDNSGGTSIDDMTVSVLAPTDYVASTGVWKPIRIQSL